MVVCGTAAAGPFILLTPFTVEVAPDPPEAPRSLGEMVTTAEAVKLDITASDVGSPGSKCGEFVREGLTNVKKFF